MKKIPIQKSRKIYTAILILLAAALIEAVMAMFPYFAYVAGRKGGRFSDLNGESWAVTEGCPEYVMRFEPDTLNSVSFSIEPFDSYGYEYFTDVTVLTAPEDSPMSFRTVTTKRIAVGSGKNEKLLYISPEYKSGELMLKFSETGFNLSDVTVNPRFVPHFIPLRFILLLLVMLFAYFVIVDRETRTLLKSFRFKNVAIITVSFCACISLVYSVLCATGDAAKPYDYPNDADLAARNPYIQQFDAFRKGQLNIDVEPSGELLALENPYDAIERGDAEILWDRAFVNGKYYSYFGTAPIFTVYYPYYLLTGSLPADSVVSGVFSLLVSIFLPLAVMLISRLIDKKISPWYAAMLAIASLGASLAFIIQRGYAPFYYIASLAGTAFASMALMFFVLAECLEKKKSKTVCLVFSGIGFALCIHSRLNAALPAGALIAAAYFIRFAETVREKKPGKFFGEVIPFLVPAIIGAAAAMLYNNARFGSPFDFGTAYQLTVTDTSAYSLSLSGLMPTLYHYFIQPFILTSEFPYIGIGISALTDFGKYVYTDSNIGIFAMPFMLSLFGAVAVFKNRLIEKKKKIMLAVSLAAIILTAFADFCLGGVIFRYTADIAPVAAITSAAVLMMLYGAYTGEKRNMLRKQSAALCSVNGVVTLASMMMINANLADYSTLVYEMLRNLFVFWK